MCGSFFTIIGHGYGTLVEADMRADMIVELAHHGPENILAYRKMHSRICAIIVGARN